MRAAYRPLMPRSAKPPGLAAFSRLVSALPERLIGTDPSPGTGVQSSTSAGGEYATPASFLRFSVRFSSSSESQTDLAQGSGVTVVDPGSRELKGTVQRYVDPFPEEARIAGETYKIDKNQKGAKKGDGLFSEVQIQSDRANVLNLSVPGWRNWQTHRT